MDFDQLDLTFQHVWKVRAAGVFHFKSGPWGYETRRKQVAELTRSNEELKAEKRELENQGAQRWFMIGSGVVVGGILIVAIGQAKHLGAVPLPASLLLP